MRHRFQSLPRGNHGSEFVVAFVAASIPLMIASMFVVLGIANDEPFYGLTPTQIRQAMTGPIVLLGLWLLWCVAVGIAAMRERIRRSWDVLLFWAGIWIYALILGLHAYVLDLAVLESPDKNWIIQHGTATWADAPASPHWFLVLLFGFASCLWFRRWPARAGRRPLSAGLCAACGYNLRASPGRCPECGTAPEASMH